MIGRGNDEILAAGHPGELFDLPFAGVMGFGSPDSTGSSQTRGRLSSLSATRASFLSFSFFSSSSVLALGAM